MMDESRPLPMFRCEQIEGNKLAKEWQEWKGSLEYYFESSQITDQKLKRSKMLHLGGPQLQKVFQTLEGTENFPMVLRKKPWYDVAVECLDNYFRPRRQEVLERHKLRNIKQGSSERFAHFVLRLRQQLSECGLEKYPPKVRKAVEEIMMIDVIVEGCSSQELRRRILEKDRPLNDIEALGESLESVQVQEKELGSGSAATDGGRLEVHKVQSVVSRKTELKQDRVLQRFGKTGTRGDGGIVCYACGNLGHITSSAECPAREQTCRRCRRVGHFEKVCRKRPGQSPKVFPAKVVRAVNEVTDPEIKKESATASTEEKKVYYTFYTGNQTNEISCRVGGVNVEMFVDSGSDANLITSETWTMLKSKQVTLRACTKGSTKVLKAYGSPEPLTILGTFQAVIEIGQRSGEAEFCVVQGGQRNLLGDATSKELGVLKIGVDINQVIDGKPDMAFSKAKGIKVHVKMDPKAVPVFQPLRRIPIPLEDAVNKKLDELLKRDIIEPMEGPASWVSPLVVAKKANGDIRLCVDLRRVNQAVVRERHPMPVIDEVLAKIGRGKIWSIMDIKDAFFLLELDDETKNVMVFITHRGLYRFKRMPFGLVSAPEIYQRFMDGILADCEGAYWYLDDVGVEGSTLEEHDMRLDKVLRRLKENGVVLNHDKCKFRVTEFDFLGHRISASGILPSSSKQEAVLNFRQPSNDSELRSFLGLANYMGKFVSNLATIDEPLRRLTQKGVEFQWGEDEEKAFQAIKDEIANASCLGFYRLEDDTSVVADASPVGLGAVLIQTNDQNESRVVCFASKSLTDTERRYCQTEKEALAIVWSVERFQVYLIGRQFNLLTDCKALTFLFSPVSRPCARIERWVLRLQGFQYRIVHISGASNIADVLSRLSTIAPKAFDEAEELMVHEIASAAAAAIVLSWDDIERASREDPDIQLVFESLETGNTDEMPLSYRMISKELCRLHDVLLRTDRIVIPKVLQDRVLHLAHEGHPGMRIMKGHLRANVWWPKMDQHVEKFVKSCRGCSLVAVPNPPEPLIRKQLPSRAWEQIAIDFFGPLPDGEHLLVCVDYFSRFTEVAEMKDTSTSCTIFELMTIFSRYGIPESIRADNGPQFTSDEFKAFCEEFGIHLVHSIPYWPQMNGEVERQNRSILKRLQIAHDLGKDWRMELRKYLLTYHAANHTTTGKPPSELMFGRRIRTKLPSLLSALHEYEEVLDRDVVEKEKGKQYADKRRKARPNDIKAGDQVLCKRFKKDNKLESDFAPETFDVIDKQGTDVTVRSTVSGKEFSRSAAHLKVVNHKEADVDPVFPGSESSAADDVSLDKEQGDPVTPGQDTAVASTSKRVRSEPKRFQDFITY